VDTQNPGERQVKDHRGSDEKGGTDEESASTSVEETLIKFSCCLSSRGLLIWGIVRDESACGRRRLVNAYRIFWTRFCFLAEGSGMTSLEISMDMSGVRGEGWGVFFVGGRLEASCE